MLINVNYPGNCTNNKKSPPDLQNVLQFPLQTLFSTSIDLLFIELRSSCMQFLRNTEWWFLIPNFTRIGQELWATQWEIHLFGQRRATVTESFLTKFNGAWQNVQSLIRGHRRTDGRTFGRCFHVRLCSFSSSRTPKTKRVIWNPGAE